MGSFLSRSNLTTAQPPNTALFHKPDYKQILWNCTDPRPEVCPPCGSTATHDLTLGETYPFWLGTSVCYSSTQVINVLEDYDTHFSPNVKWVENRMAAFYRDAALAKIKLLDWEKKSTLPADDEETKDRIYTEKVYYSCLHSLEGLRQMRDLFIVDALLGWSPRFNGTLLLSMTTKEQRHKLETFGVKILTDQQKADIKECKGYKKHHKKTRFREKGCEATLSVLDNPARNATLGKHKHSNHKHSKSSATKLQPTKRFAREHDPRTVKVKFNASSFTHNASSVTFASWVLPGNARCLLGYARCRLNHVWRAYANEADRYEGVQSRQKTWRRKPEGMVREHGVQSPHNHEKEEHRAYRDGAENWKSPQAAAPP